MLELYRYIKLRFKYARKNDLSTAICRFQGRKSLLKYKLRFFKKFVLIANLNNDLYTKLSQEDKELFVAWLFKRHIGGGGGVTLPEKYGYMLFKANSAFLEAEKLYNARDIETGIMTTTINNKKVLWQMDRNDKKQRDSITNAESYHLYPIAHALLNQYYLDGFNANNGETIIDCGGCIGDTALFFNAYFPDSAIHAFECDDKTYMQLQENIALNKLENRIFPHKKALGFRNETLFFEKYRIVKTQTKESVAVECITIDSFVREHNIAHVGLIKMEIGGGEENILRGAENTIKLHKPNLMISISHTFSSLEIPTWLNTLGLDVEYRLKWIEMRAWHGGCILFVRFV